MYTILKINRHKYRYCEKKQNDYVTDFLSLLLKYCRLDEEGGCEGKLYE